MPFDIIRNVRAYVYSRDDLSSNEVLVLRILADYANAEGYAWPSLPTLQKHLSKILKVHHVHVKVHHVHTYLLMN